MDEEGLGYCFLGTTIYQPQQIIDVLQLPKLVMPVATLTVGWPDEEPSLSDRLPTESFVHQERYNDYLGQDIDNYYYNKEHLPENEQFVRINNKETLAQVFTDIRYTRKDNEALSAELIKALVRQDFLPHTVLNYPYQPSEFILLFYNDWLIFRNQCLHDAPAYQIGHCTDAEHHHIGSRFSFKSEERVATSLSSCPVEELTRTEVNGIGMGNMSPMVEYKLADQA